MEMVITVEAATVGAGEVEGQVLAQYVREDGYEYLTLTLGQVGPTTVAGRSYRGDFHLDLVGETWQLESHRFSLVGEDDGDWNRAKQAQYDEALTILDSWAHSMAYEVAQKADWVAYQKGLG